MNSSNILRWILSYFVDVLPYGDTDVRVNCIFCPKEDIGHHLHISIQQSMYHCFRCGASGNWIDLIAYADGCSVNAAVARLHSLGDAIVVPLYQLLREKRKTEMHMPDTFLTIPDALCDKSAATRLNAELANRYIKIRLYKNPMDVYHYSMEYYLREWGVWKGEEGYGKLVLPIEDGWWQERNILSGHAGPKYSSAASPKEHRLYNAKVLDGEFGWGVVDIAEGVFSAVYLGKNAVALCGKQATPEQTTRLCNAKIDKYVVSLDADTMPESLELAGALYQHKKAVTIRVYEDGDPAEYTTYTEVVYSPYTSIELELTAHRSDAMELLRKASRRYGEDTSLRRRPSRDGKLRTPRRDIRTALESNGLS